MPPHDAYLRRTPWELLLPEEGYADRRFPEIEEEAEARQSDPDDPAAFVLLGQVGRLLQEIRGDAADDPEAIHRYGALLFHCFHYWRAGRPTWLLSTHAARYLVEGDPVPEGWEGGTPDPAGFLQLPRHLFWTAGAEDTPEAVDGIFWTRTGMGVSLLLATGIRPGRPGLGVIPLPPVPSGELVRWTGMDAREVGEDFETTLPGGELERLYSLETGGEAVKLAARAFWLLGSGAGEVTREEPPGEARTEEAEATEAPRDQGAPPPSGLPYRRIGVAGAG